MSAPIRARMAATLWNRATRSLTAMFDTLKFARTLRDRGHFSPEQAEGLADAVAEALETEVAGRADLKATEAALHGEIGDLRETMHAEFAKVRSDIAEVRAELKTEIAELRAELKAEVAELRAELKAEVAELRTETRIGMKALEAKIERAQANTIKWVVGIIGIQGVAFIAAVWVMARTLSH